MKARLRPLKKEQHASCALTETKDAFAPASQIDVLGMSALTQYAQELAEFVRFSYPMQLANF
jgi:hypothetical protein